jgi:hypothetical protein
MRWHVKRAKKVGTKITKDRRWNAKHAKMDMYQIKMMLAMEWKVQSVLSHHS